MQILYWTGQNSGFGDIIKGLSSLKVYAEAINEKVFVSFILPVKAKKSQLIYQIKELVDCLEPCDLLEFDWDGEKQILSDFFSPQIEPNKRLWKPEILWSSKKALQNYIDTGHLREEHLRTRDDIKNWCDENGISPYQLITFRYTAIPYWKSKYRAKNSGSNIVTIQTERYPEKGLDENLPEKIIDHIKQTSNYQVVVTNTYRSSHELFEVMQQSRFHICPPSGTAHVAACLSLPCLVIVATGKSKRWTLHQGFQDIGNFQYANSRPISNEDILKVTDWDRELELNKSHVLNMVENDIKFMQVFARMSFEDTTFTKSPDEPFGWPCDYELVNWWAHERTKAAERFKNLKK